VNAAGNIYLLDRTHEGLKLFDPCACAFRVVSCRGTVLRGRGRRPDGWFQGATAIAIVDGDLFVANPDAEVVYRFSLNGLVLREVLAPPPGRPGSLPVGQRWRPRALAADSRGHLWVADRDNGRVDRFAPRGNWVEGWSGLGDVAHVALDCADGVYLVIAGQPPLICRLEGGVLRPVAGDPPDLREQFPPLPFPVDVQGRLHLEAWCEHPCTGTAIFEADGAIVPRDSAAKLPLYAAVGKAVSQPLDSAIDRCVWHRVVLSGVVPANTSVEVQVTTAPIELAPDEIEEADWQSQAVWHPAATRPAPPLSRDAGDWDCLVRSPPGRYAWLRLILRGDGSATPAVGRIVVEFPRVSLRRFLPAVFGAEPVSADFTDRFLGIFDTQLRSIERQLDEQVRLFDPASAPADPGPGGRTDFLTWLGTWIGIALDRHWPEERRRRFLKAAPTFFSARGTRQGLQAALLTYLGMDGASNCARQSPRRRCLPWPSNCGPPDPCTDTWERPALILEHYQLRRWLQVGQGRLGDDSVVWGRSIVNRSQLGSNAQVGVTQLKSVPDPARDPFLVYAHRYTVFVPARVRASAQERKGLENLLRAESPAHTAYDVRYVEPRFRVGVQATLGYDAVVARIPQGVRLGDATLRQGAVLTGAPRKRKGPAMTVGGEARVGTSTKVT
jgi:phage tail-like protein